MGATLTERGEFHEEKSTWKDIASGSRDLLVVFGVLSLLVSLINIAIWA